MQASLATAQEGQTSDRDRLGKSLLQWSSSGNSIGSMTIGNKVTISLTTFAEEKKGLERWWKRRS